MNKTSKTNASLKGYAFLFVLIVFFLLITSIQVEKPEITYNAVPMGFINKPHASQHEVSSNKYCQRAVENILGFSEIISHPSDFPNINTNGSSILIYNYVETKSHKKPIKVNYMCSVSFNGGIFRIKELNIMNASTS